MEDASLSLQTAIYEKLNGDAPLLALATGGVFDDVPAGTSFPYIVLSEITAVDDGSSLFEGFEHSIEVQVWSSARGKQELFKIMGLIDPLLHDQPLTLTDHKLISLHRVDRRTFRDAQPEVRRGVMEFRAVTEEE